MLSMAMWMVLGVTPLQIMVGDAHGLNTLQYQPAKIAAIEGHWRNRPGESTPLILFGVPDMQAQETRGAIEVPYLGSLILTHDWHGRVAGLSEFRPEDRPNSPVIFWTFRVMVGLGMLMLLLSCWSVWLRWRSDLYSSRAFLGFATLMGPAGVAAILAGWLTTEIGRQPWVVYGVMRTRDAVSNHSLLSLSMTLSLFVVMYIAVFGIGVYYLLRLIAQGPREGMMGHAGSDPVGRPARPLSAVATYERQAMDVRKGEP